MSLIVRQKQRRYDGEEERAKAGSKNPSLGVSTGRLVQEVGRVGRSQQ